MMLKNYKLLVVGVVDSCIKYNLEVVVVSPPSLEGKQQQPKTNTF